MAPIAEVMAIRSGPCGPECVQRDQFERTWIYGIHDGPRDRDQVVMEGFRLHEAAPPAPITAGSDAAGE